MSRRNREKLREARRMKTAQTLDKPSKYALKQRDRMYPKPEPRSQAEKAQEKLQSHFNDRSEEVLKIWVDDIPEEDGKGIHQLQDVQIPYIPLKEAREILRSAVADLGEDLGGLSVVDLLADNFCAELDECRRIAAVLKNERDYDRSRRLSSFEN